jgi:hypothetical protein
MYGSAFDEGLVFSRDAGTDRRGLPTFPVD